jgi:hypothetical protein
MRIRTLVLLAAALVLAAPALAAPPARVGAQFRYWDFSNGNDLRDRIVYWAQGPFHVQLEHWDFIEGEDQFRPEVGLHLRDRRRAVYTIQWRHENDRERFTFGTDQVLARQWVGRAEVSPIVGDGFAPEVVLAAGTDYYWGSYDFASVTLVRDPRDGGLWTLPMRVRLANESNDWVQAVLVPASQRSVGWALDGKLRWARAGIERNSRYDFTSVDNLIFTVGVEFDIRPRR